MNQILQDLTRAVRTTLDTLADAVRRVVDFITAPENRKLVLAAFAVGVAAIVVSLRRRER
jgi:hypothetical protein